MSMLIGSGVVSLCLAVTVEMDVISSCGTLYGTDNYENMLYIF